MFLTKEFEKVLQTITALAIFASLFYLILFAIGIRHNVLEDEPSTGFFILYVAPQVLLIGGFWYSLYYLTGEKIGSLVGGFIHLSSNVYLLFSYNAAAAQTSPTSLSTTHWVSIFGLLFAVLAFALLQYKAWKKVRIFLLLFFILYGMKVGTYQYFNFLEEIVEITGWRDPLSLVFTIEEGRKTSINVLATLTSNFFLPVWIICFWWLHRVISNERKLDGYHLTIEYLEPADQRVMNVHNVRNVHASSLLKKSEYISTLPRLFSGFRVAIISPRRIWTTRSSGSATR